MGYRLMDDVLGLVNENNELKEEKDILGNKLVMINMINSKLSNKNNKLEIENKELKFMVSELSEANRFLINRI